MKVVLYKTVPELGNRGDVVDVSDGYGRNSLIPQGYAAIATKGVENQAQAMKRAWQLRDEKDKEFAEELAKNLVSKPCVITAKSGGEGKLFGSVTSADIAEAINQQFGSDIDRKMIDLPENIRTVGNYSINIRPHKEVQFPVQIEVISE